MDPRFEPLTSTSGLTILDPIEKRRFSLLTPTPVSPTPADPDDFYFPVTVARSVSATEIELPYTISVYVRDEEGTMITDVEPPADVSLPRDRYLVELSSPVKLYLRVESALDVEATTESVRFSFGEETTVTVGARSRHESPAGTVTVPDDPEGMMTGLSVLSSSLKTTSPERSFPTLRGHPPRLERGDNVEVPGGFERPDTAITIEVPPEYEKLYPVAPLAFYLGAELVPGDAPRLVTDAGFEHRFDSRRGFEGEVERVLRQTFFLDCVVRTEGYYPIRLAEREQVESRLDFDFADLYDRSLAEQVAQYLEVPYATIEDAVPTWHRVTFMRPDAENVELLPYVVNDMSLVRTPPNGESAESEDADELWDAIDDFQRNSSGAETFVRGASGDRSDEFARNVRNDRRQIERDFVSVPETDTIETAWAGRGTPTSGTKLLKSAYEHERPVSRSGIIDVTVVCNDSRMRAERDMVSEIYGNREDVSIETNIEFGVGKDELRELLQEPTDLFHYIGHVDEGGFNCTDGFLDSSSIDEVNVKAFLLNACNSINQGEALIDSGASAGIVSLSEVSNRSAVEFGETLAKLLNYGFSVGTTLGIAKRYTSIGSRYIAVGDVGLTLAQTENQVPVIYEITEETENCLEITAYGYPTRNYPIGSMTSLFVAEGTKQYLLPGYLTTFEISPTSFKYMAKGFSTLLIFEGEFTWLEKWPNT